MPTYVVGNHLLILLQSALQGAVVTDSTMPYSMPAEAASGLYW